LNYRSVLHPIFTMVSEAGKEVEIIALEGLISIVVNGTKGRSWVYDYVLKIGTDESSIDRAPNDTILF
jgi:hypothetical protein